MTMSTAPLVLSTLQQQWLLEMQVAAPFLAPYREKINRSVAAPVASTAIAKTTAPRPATNLSKDLRASLVPAETSARQPSLKSDDVLAAAPVVEKAPVKALAQMTLEQLAAFSQQCDLCELHTSRVQAVFGAGQTQQPDWFVVSTAPSSNEELEGLPMQGKSGELFAAQLHSIGIDPTQQLYMTQLLKCRADSKTQTDYIQACQGLLWRQIALIQPRRLLLLGSKAAMLFLGEAASFEALRGKVHQWQEPSSGRQLPVVVSYHPSSILLRPQLKAQSWSDLLLCKQLQDE